MLKKVKSLNWKYWQTILLWFVYLIGFLIIDNRVLTDFTLIHCGLDDIIPFCEYFIIPYYIWFPYMVLTFFYVFFTNKLEYFKLAIPLFAGMFLFLIISVVFPNGQNMRPLLDADKNVFTKLVSVIYNADTSNNIMPSIHVYNSILSHYAIIHSGIGKKRWVRIVSLIICILICASTVFLKQHSILDGFGAVVMFIIFALPCCHWKKIVDFLKKKVVN